MKKYKTIILLIVALTLPLSACQNESKETNQRKTETSQQSEAASENQNETEVKVENEETSGIENLSTRDRIQTVLDEYDASEYDFSILDKLKKEYELYTPFYKGSENTYINEQEGKLYKEVTDYNNFYDFMTTVAEEYQTSGYPIYMAYIYQPIVELTIENVMDIELLDAEAVAGGVFGKPHLYASAVDDAGNKYYISEYDTDVDLSKYSVGNKIKFLCFISELDSAVSDGLILSPRASFEELALVTEENS